MNYDLLFGLAFLSQIIAISIYLPWRIERTADRLFDEMEIEDGSKAPKSFAFYRLLNRFAVMVGLGLGGSFFALDFFEAMTPKLASIGLYFFLQMLPLLTPAAASTLAHAGNGQGQEGSKVGLLDVVSPLAVGLAVALIVAFLAINLAAWDGTKDTQLLKMAIFAGTNLFFAAIIMQNFITLKRADSEAALKHLRDLKRTVPAMIYLSIGVSIYQFGKTVLFRFDLIELRPTMMSIALLLLATLSLGAQLRKQ